MTHHLSGGCRDKKSGYFAAAAVKLAGMSGNFLEMRRLDQLVSRKRCITQVKGISGSGGTQHEKFCKFIRPQSVVLDMN